MRGQHKISSSFALAASVMIETAYLNAQCFWSMFRKFRFSLWSMPPPDPYFIMHQKPILPHQNAKFAPHHINKPIKNNMAVLTWYWTSIAVNILYVCYFLKLQKFLSPSRFFCFVTERQLIPDNVCSLLKTIQNV